MTNSPTSSNPVAVRVICAICAKDVDSVNTVECCGEPLCIEPCYETHAEEEHGLEPPLS